MDSLFVWFLITVLPSGQVGDAKGFPTRAICEEARSAAEYGVGVAERIKRDSEARAEREAIAKRLDSIEAIITAPRHPKSKADSALIRQWKADKKKYGSDSDLVMVGGNGCFGWVRNEITEWEGSSDYVDEDGLIRREWCERMNGWSGREDLKPSLKYSACVRKE